MKKMMLIMLAVGIVSITSSNAQVNVSFHLEHNWSIPYEVSYAADHHYHGYDIVHVNRYDYYGAGYYNVLFQKHGRFVEVHFDPFGHVVRRVRYDYYPLTGHHCAGHCGYHPVFYNTYYKQYHPHAHYNEVHVYKHAPHHTTTHVYHNGNAHYKGYDHNTNVIHHYSDGHNTTVYHHNKEPKRKVVYTNDAVNRNKYMERPGTGKPNVQYKQKNGQGNGNYHKGNSNARQASPAREQVNRNQNNNERGRTAVPARSNATRDTRDNGTSSHRQSNSGLSYNRGR